MPIIVSTGSRAYLPTTFQFAYGGVANAWGTQKLTEMGDVTCRSEPIDGKFTSSELSVKFSDTDGSIWGSLGHGTTCLGSSWTATALVGGEFASYQTGPNESRNFVDQQVYGQPYPIFSGRITEVRRANREVEIVAQTNMARVEDLEWEFPVYGQFVNDEPGFFIGSYGSNFFLVENENLGSSALYWTYNRNAARDQWENYCWVGSVMSEADFNTLWPPTAGRGTLGTASSAYRYRGGSFRQNFERIHFEGSYLGTLSGTIDSDSEANSYGFSSASDAEAAKSGGSYVINKTRFVARGHTGAFKFGSGFYLEQAGLTLSGNPAVLWREMLVGGCVTALFGTNLIDAASYATVARIEAFRAYSCRIPPEGGKVLPFIKNLLEPLQARWAMGAQNEFKLFTYTPKILSDVTTSIGSHQIFSSEIGASEDDIVNRVVLNYAYQFETGSYTKSLEKKSAFWGTQLDKPLVLSSKWLSNENDANILVTRIIKKNERGFTRLGLRVPFSFLSADVGSLFTVTDEDCLTGSRVFEVSSWRHSFSEAPMVDLRLVDAVGYYKRGYARWENSGFLNSPVTSSSKSGWGTQGTTLGINESNYGTMFVWF